MLDSSNPPLSPWVRILFLLVALILCVGVGLLLIPSLVVPRWLWELTPFNARFLGAIYLTELSVVVPFLLNNRRSPGRMVLPSAFTFVAIISVLSLFYLDHFNLQRLTTIAWFVVYFVPTLLLLFLLWASRDLLASVTTHLPHPWPRLLLIESILLFVYGLALLIVPSLATAEWPWPIDPFHARMYSAFFLTMGVASWIVARGAGRLDVLTLGIAHVVTGVGVIGGLLAVDLAARRIQWANGGTWLWIGAFAVIGLIGVLLLGVSRQKFSFTDG